MEHLYAPWRSDYFSEKLEGCIFCHISQNPESDEKHKVFYRDNQIFCVMNKYPYTPGHFLIVPHCHSDSPDLLDEEIWLHLHKFSKKGVALLKDFGAEGINLGMNLQKAGGAGIPAHLHLHLIPRFIGDTNFFTTIGDCRAYGVDFDKIFEKIRTLSLQHFVNDL